ncbi:MAG: hypothetical protein ABI207_03480 [Crocinitomicaceae bacterium]
MDKINAFLFQSYAIDLLITNLDELRHRENLILIAFTHSVLFIDIHNAHTNFDFIDLDYK